MILRANYCKHQCAAPQMRECPGEQGHTGRLGQRPGAPAPSLPGASASIARVLGARGPAVQQGSAGRAAISSSHKPPVSSQLVVFLPHQCHSYAANSKPSDSPSGAQKEN